MVRGLCEASSLDRKYVLDFDQNIGPLLKGKF